MPGIDGYETCRRLKADPETRRRRRHLPLRARGRAGEGARARGGGRRLRHEALPAGGGRRAGPHAPDGRSGCGPARGRNAELARELQVAQELLTDARRRVEGALLGVEPGRARAARVDRAARGRRRSRCSSRARTGRGRRRSPAPSTTRRRGAARRSSTSTARCSRRGGDGDPGAGCGGPEARSAGCAVAPQPAGAGRARHALPRGDPPAAAGKSRCASPSVLEGREQRGSEAGAGRPTCA